MATKLSHAANEYDEGLQRAPELESSVVTTAVWQVDSSPRHHTARAVVAAATEQVLHMQQANHGDGNQKTNDAEGAAAAAAAAVVVARAPSAQTNEGRMERDRRKLPL